MAADYTGNTTYAHNQGVREGRAERSAGEGTAGEVYAIMRVIR
jgi:hypothetical protein